MIAANSWFLCTLIGLGLIPLLVFTDKSGWIPSFAPRNLIHTLALLLMFGLLIDHAIGIVSGDLRVQSAVGWFSLLGFVGVLAFFALAFQHDATPHPSRLQAINTGTGLLAAFVFIALLALAISAEPLVAWDARSIWFFHAKAIFFDHGLQPSSFWLNEAYDWSHKYYPQLTSMLAARYADFMLGNWNEFAPKGALVPLALATTMGLLALYKNGVQVLLIVGGVITLFGDQLWSGYQDGWLALFGCITVCALARWSTTSRREDLLLGIASAAIALCLKNEGQLLIIVASVPLLYGIFLIRKDLHVRDYGSAVCFLPFILWVLVKPSLPTGEGMESAGLIGRAISVVFDWSELTYRISFLFQYVLEHTFLLHAAITFLLVGLCVRLNRTDVLIALSALMYTAGLGAVYLGTPYDFDFHVEFSLDRVTLLPTLLFLIGVIQMIPRLAFDIRQLIMPTLAVWMSDNR